MENFKQCSHCQTPVVFEGKGDGIPEYDVCGCGNWSCPEHSYLLNPQTEEDITEVCHDCKKQQLVDAVIARIRNDIREGDFTAIDELLKTVPMSYLIGYLPEEQWVKYKGQFLHSVKLI